MTRSRRSWRSQASTRPQTSTSSPARLVSHRSSRTQAGAREPWRATRWQIPAEGPVFRPRQGGQKEGDVETPETPFCSVCGQSFDSEDELRATRRNSTSEKGSERGGDTGGEQRGSTGPSGAMAASRVQGSAADKNQTPGGCAGSKVWSWFRGMLTRGRFTLFQRSVEPHRVGGRLVLDPAFHHAGPSPP
jgi:hypothetical protein